MGVLREPSEAASQSSFTTPASKRTLSLPLSLQCVDPLPLSGGLASHLAPSIDPIKPYTPHTEGADSPLTDWGEQEKGRERAEHFPS